MEHEIFVTEKSTIEEDGTIGSPIIRNVRNPDGSEEIFINGVLWGYVTKDGIGREVRPDGWNYHTYTD